jgi:D-tyrosyl-tRNA(Tyr) deacylase
VILVGITDSDQPEDSEYLAKKTLNMRLFPYDLEETGFEQSAIEVGAQILVISQFTLYASTRKGRRPSFTEASSSVNAEPLFENLVFEFRKSGLDVHTGVFGAYMRVQLENSGPTTIVLDTADRHAPRHKS